MKLGFANDVCVSLMLLGTILPAISRAGAPDTFTAAYVGDRNQETRIRFHSQVEVSAFKAPTDRQVSEAIENQIHMLAGPMIFGDDKGHLTLSPKRTHAISGIQVAADPIRPGVQLISYDYDGEAVIDQNPPKRIPVILAFRPDQTYKASRALLKTGETNPCTDDHYQSLGDFWYFWSPLRDGCKLVRDKDYLVVTAELSPIINTVDSLPDYSRMINAQGVIPVTVFMGKSEALSPGNPYLVKEDPKNSTDDAKVYVLVANNLLKQGFVRVTRDIREKPATFISEDFEKPVVDSWISGVTQVRVRLFYGDTKYYTTTSRQFHLALKPALENDAVVIYSGHSGLGRNMGLDYIAKSTGIRITLNPSLYQLIMFESCSSYDYYNEDYFTRKATPEDPQGTHNLDIITNGIESDFLPGADRINSVIEAVDTFAQTGKKKTYSEILAKFPNLALTGVVGDEDNPARGKAPSPAKRLGAMQGLVSK
jgi:hypothetical protein